MEQDQGDNAAEALLTQMRQKEMIECELQKGRKRQEIIALFGFDNDIFDVLERNIQSACSDFRRAETVSFLTDLDFLRTNLDNKDFNSKACELLFANRHGWSLKPNKSIKPLLSATEILSAVLNCELDVDLGINMLRAVALTEEIKTKAEDRQKILPMIEMLEKYRKDNNL